MKKKILAIILSAAMAAGQFSCVYGAEFSSGEENSGFEEQETVFPDEESVFSSGEAEDMEDISETELFSTPEEEQDIFTEEKLSDETQLLNASTVQTAQELVPGGEYTISCTNREGYWFKFTPDRTGGYLIISEDEPTSESQVQLYSESEGFEQVMLWGNSYDTSYGKRGNCLKKELIAGETYYYYVWGQSYRDDIDNWKCKVLFKEYDRNLEGRIKNIDVYSYPPVYFKKWWSCSKEEILVRLYACIEYEDQSLSTIGVWSSGECKKDKYGNQYYLELISENGEKVSSEVLPVGNYKVEVRCGNIKGSGTIQIKDQDLSKLPLLQETEKGTMITTVAKEEDEYSYARFVPKRTGYYSVCGVMGDNGGAELFDSKLSWIDQEACEMNGLYMPSYYLNAGNVYYVIGWDSLSYTASKKVDFEVELLKDMTPSVSLTKCKAALSSTSVAYTGKALTPSVKVTYGNQTLVKDKDYTLSYSKNTDLGTAQVTIKGKGNYTGTITRTFKIILGTPKLKNAASAGYNKIKVTWNAVPGAKNYIVYYKGGNVSDWKVLKKGIDGTSYTHTSSKSYPLVTGTKYTYTVKAVNGKVTSAFDKKGKTAAPALSGVNIGKVTSAGYNSLKITWSKRAGASGYIIERKEGSKWAKVFTAKASATSYIHKASKAFPIKLGTTYSYRIKAYRKVNGKTIYSGYSDVAKGKTALAKPVIKAGTSSNGITLSWKKVSGAQGYIIYRYDGEKLVEKGSTKKLSYTDKTAKKGKTYKYRVKAYCKVGGKVISSALSSTKSAKR